MSSQAHWAHICGELAALTAAETPLPQALRDVASHGHHARSAGTLRALADDLEQGATLEAAVERQRHALPAMLASLLVAAGRGARLSDILATAARHGWLADRARQRLWAMLAYPLTSFVCIAVLTLLLASFLDPVRGSGDQQLVTGEITRATIALSRHLPWVAGISLAGVAALVGLLWWGLRTPPRSGWMHSCLLQLPLVGRVTASALVARTLTTLECMLRADVRLPEALDAIAAMDGAGDPLRLTEAADRVREGRSLSAEFLDRQPLMPALACSAIATGERNGDLPRALDSVSDLVMTRFERELAIGLQVVQPLVYLALGVFVYIVARELLLPLVAFAETSRW